MKSAIAALRTLVLPFGATSGRRIILDGVNGLIDFYNSLGRLRMRLVSDTAQGQIRFYPETGLGSGTVYALIDSRSFTGGTEAGIFIRGTIDGSGNFMGTFWTPDLWRSGYQSAAFSAEGGLFYADRDITLHGYYQSDVPVAAGLAQGDAYFLGMWVDETHFKQGLVAFESGGIGFARLVARDDAGNTNQSSVTCSEDGFVTIAGSLSNNGDPVISRANTNVNTSSTPSFTNTETVTDTVTALLVDGATYEITWTANITASVATDTLLTRIRQDNLAGAQLAGGRVIPNTTATYGPILLRARYTATASANKTFVVTGVRNAGAGNFVRFGNADNPSILSVDRVG